MATVSVEEHGLATNIKEYVPLMFELVQSNPAVIAWVVYEWPTGETSKSFDEAWTSIAPVPVKVAFKIAVESDPSEREMLASVASLVFHVLAQKPGKVWELLGCLREQPLPIITPHQAEIVAQRLPRECLALAHRALPKLTCWQDVLVLQLLLTSLCKNLLRQAVSCSLCVPCPQAAIRF